jgi:hypothetical protein
MQALRALQIEGVVPPRTASIAQCMPNDLMANIGSFLSHARELCIMSRTNRAWYRQIRNDARAWVNATGSIVQLPCTTVVAATSVVAPRCAWKSPDGPDKKLLVTRFCPAIRLVSIQRRRDSHKPWMRDMLLSARYMLCHRLWSQLRTLELVDFKMTPGMCTAIASMSTLTSLTVNYGRMAHRAIYRVSLKMPSVTINRSLISVYVWMVNVTPCRNMYCGTVR